jgi:peptidyl-prolyl cis-trans isomerase C
VPVQPGNSGGALLDSKGSVVGIVTSKLNAAKILSTTGDIPQNVNYAVKIKYILAMIDGLPKVRDELALPSRKPIKNNEEVVKVAEASTFLVRVTQKPSITSAALPVPAGERRDLNPPIPSGEILAVINGTPIPMSRFYAMLKTMQKNGQQDTQKLRDLIREELINREILMEESYRLGLAPRENIRDPQTDMAHQSIVIRALVADFASKNPVNDAEVRREYELFKSQAGNTEYHARHILVQTEPEALAIINRMNNGESIESLAYLSNDPGSAKNGGDLKWAPPTAFVKPFADALRALQKDTYTATPVKTQFGFHVIKLDDSRPAVVPALETVEKQIRESLMQKRLQTFQQGLRARSTIQ